MLPHLDRILACTNCLSAIVKDGLPACSKGAGPVYAEESTCPENRWGAVFVANLIDQQNGTPPLSPERIAQRVKAEQAKSFWQKAASFIEVTTSGLASDADIAVRRQSCSTCPVKKTNGQGEEYCGACGCGENRWSILDRKLTYKKLPCPLDRPGFYAGAAEPGAGGP